jgi:hypothetical protein
VFAPFTDEPHIAACMAQKTEIAVLSCLECDRVTCGKSFPPIHIKAWGGSTYIHIFLLTHSR